MRTAHRRIGIEHHHLVEERIHHRPQRGNLRQRLAIRSLLAQLRNFGASARRRVVTASLASGASFTLFGDPIANPFSSACRRMFLIRLNAAEIAAKSADPRAAVNASARAIASRTSSAPAASTAFTTS